MHLLFVARALLLHTTITTSVVIGTAVAIRRGCGVISIDHGRLAAIHCAIVCVAGFAVVIIIVVAPRGILLLGHSVKFPLCSHCQPPPSINY